MLALQSILARILAITTIILISACSAVPELEEEAVEPRVELSKAFKEV